MGALNIGMKLVPLSTAQSKKDFEIQKTQIYNNKTTTTIRNLFYLF